VGRAAMTTIFLALLLSLSTMIILRSSPIPQAKVTHQEMINQGRLITTMVVEVAMKSHHHTMVVVVHGH
jgi:hypothetical protein